MSSRHKRIYRKRAKDQHVVCVNCNTRLKMDSSKSRYRQRYPLTNRLQDRRWDPSRKPGISILEGLIETIPELAAGDISHYLSAMCICHECHISLRQVVNYKFKVQNQLLEFQKKIGNVTNEMRLETTKQANETGKTQKCWVCQQGFPKYEGRFSLDRSIIDDLTVKEAVESVLPDESATLQDGPHKHTMICEQCFKTLSRIITVQCRAETLRQSFIEKTNENGLIGRIQEYDEDFDMFDDNLADNTDDADNVNNDEMDNDDNYNDFDDTVSENLDDSTVDTSGNIIVIAAETATPNEDNTGDFRVVKAEKEPADELTVSSDQVGRKRKLSQSDFEANVEALSEAETEEEFLEHEMRENYEENEEKQRRLENADVLSLIPCTKTELNDENVEMLEETKMIVDDGIPKESVNENILKKVVYCLQKHSLQKALKILQKNFGEFEKEIHKLAVDYIRKELSEENSLESSDWSKLSSLHEGNVTLNNFIESFQEKLPLLGTVLCSSITGQKQLDFTKLERRSLLRLLTVMGIIAYETNPKCDLIQCLNSIQMAEDGCTNELYSAFYGLGLCLKEPDTQKLLASPDYSVHQVCWDLLKERQNKDLKANKITANGVEDFSDDDDGDDDDIPHDFADVCPYWKSENTTAIDDSASEWILYTDPEDPSAADLIRLIFAEAGVPYQEHIESFDDVTNSQRQGFPVFNLPAVRKGDLTLTQVPVICRHLGEIFDLCPETAEDKIAAEQICHACHEIALEGRLLEQELEKVDKKTSVSPLKEPFEKIKIRRFLRFLESSLQASKNRTGFFFDNHLTYADLAVFHTLTTLDQQLPDILKQIKDFPFLQTFQEKLSARPDLKDLEKTE